MFAADTGMPPADTEGYKRLQEWRDVRASTAIAFLPLGDRGVVAHYHVRLAQLGLNLAAVYLLIKWAAPDLEAHEALLYLSLVERATGLEVDVSKGVWKPTVQFVG